MRVDIVNIYLLLCNNVVNHRHIPMFARKHRTNAAYRINITYQNKIEWMVVLNFAPEMVKNSYMHLYLKSSICEFKNKCLH